MGPLILPSLPITTLFGRFPALNQEPNAAVNFTMSMGDSVSPGLPPMVPRIPDMLLINATVLRV